MKYKSYGFTPHFLLYTMYMYVSDNKHYYYYIQYFANIILAIQINQQSIYLNFRPLEVVSRNRDPQLHVAAKLLIFL